MNFSPYPFEPTNLSAVGMIYDSLDAAIEDIIHECKTYGLCVPAYKVTESLERHEIDYMQLPQYLKDKIDNELEVY